jgi:peptidylamidoglycolate lyase
LATAALLLGCAPRYTTAVDARATETAISLMTNDAVAEQMDTYTYTSASMPAGNHYIRWFEPKADMAVVHHMLLFGCEGEVSPTLHTRSGGMFSAGGGEPRGNVCDNTGNEPFIFGWGKNAPPLYLPENTGFRVGDGGFRSLVLEVHYLEPQSKHAVTRSGLMVHLALGVPAHAMSVLAFAQGFSLPPRQPQVLVTNTCCYAMARPLTAFAFRVHTHALGREVFLERLVAGRSTAVNTTEPADGSGPVRLMGRDPQLPQLFEALPAPLVIRPGDKLRATCVFDTGARTTYTEAGWGQGDEMCNLYLMVHAEEPTYMGCGGGSDGTSRFSVQHSPDAAAAYRAAPDADRVSVHVVPPPPPGGQGASSIGGHAAARWPASIGQVGGLANEEDGRHVWIFHRGARTWTGESFSTGHRVRHDTPIAEATIVRLCTVTGRVVAAFGAGEHYMPHGLSLGPDGSVWITDVGLHQVIRYNQTTGARMATYGTAKEPARDGHGFCMPTQVAVAEDGSFWVTDGYCNARVAHFDSSGKYVGQWGAADRKAAFEVPHSIALDSCASRIFVADRENSRVAVHALNGAMLREFDLSEHGFVYGITLLRSEEQGMAGFYAICWPRVPGRPVRLVAQWAVDGAAPSGLAHWDLPTVEVPHMLAVFGGAVGGTKGWGRGVSVFVGETRPRLGDVSLQRLWLGEDFDGAQNQIEPARGWTWRSDTYLDIPPLEGSGGTAAVSAGAGAVGWAADGPGEAAATGPAAAAAAAVAGAATEFTHTPASSSESTQRQPARSHEPEPRHGGEGGELEGSIAPRQEAEAAARAQADAANAPADRAPPWYAAIVGWTMAAAGTLALCGACGACGAPKPGSRAGAAVWVGVQLRDLTQTQNRDLTLNPEPEPLILNPNSYTMNCGP